jgi:hypothetical protein
MPAHNRVEDNADYGSFSLLSTSPVPDHDKATGNVDAGLYVGGEQDVRARVFANTSWDNKVSRNLVVGNRGEEPFGGGIVLITAEPGPGGERSPRRQRRPEERRPPQPAVRHLLGRHRQPVRGQPLQDLAAGRPVRLTGS